MYKRRNPSAVLSLFLMILSVMTVFGVGAGAAGRQDLPAVRLVAGIGAHAGCSGDGGPAANALLNSPCGAAFDGIGNMYIADTQNHCIRKIAAGSGMITTIAGTPGVRGFSGDGGTAIQSQLNSPYGVAVDKEGNIYVADTGNHCLRKISAGDGMIRTIAGIPGKAGYSGDGGAAADARLYWPWGLAVDSLGNVFVADSLNHCIRRIDAGSGIILTFAGTGGKAGFKGEGGLAGEAQLRFPHGVAMDAKDNVYITDTGNHCVRRVNRGDNSIETVAGTPGRQGFAGDDGAADRALLKMPYSVAVDATGNLYIADTFNFCIRKVDAASKRITTLAGTGEYGVSGMDMPRSGSLTQTCGVAVDQAANVYILEYDGSCVRKVMADTGKISMYAGNPGFSGDGGQAVDAALNHPQGIALDSAGNLFIADTYNHRIRRVSSSDGTICTVAGCGKAGYSGDGGAAVDAKLNFPFGVAVDTDGDVIIADSSNHRIRRVDALDGTISTINSQLAFPRNIAVDGAGNVYVEDGASNTLQMISAGDGTLRVLPGELHLPKGIAVDSKGNVNMLDSDRGKVYITGLK